MAAFPPTAIASSSSALLVASGSTLHYVEGDKTTSVSPSPDLDVRAHAAGLVRKLALSQDGKLAVSAGDDKSLRVWNVTPEGLTLRSTRVMFKRAASIQFTADNDLIVTDKVGDVYLYPLEPRAVPERPQGFHVQADPSSNPDADFLLGHVSVVSQHVLAPDGKHIITADRDEHIRVSRFPKTYVIDRYLFGSDGFVSAIHIPESQPSTLLSAGGEPTMQIWDWTTGELKSRVDIWPSILPYRRVRPMPRRSKSKRKRAGAVADIEPSDDPKSEGFYVPKEGMMLPTGQGVCVEKIDSIVVNGQTVVLFFSEGCTALHAFNLSEKKVHTAAFDLPVLGFAAHNGQIIVLLDSAYGVPKNGEFDDSRASKSIAVLDVSEDGAMTDVTASSPMTSLITSLSVESLHADGQTLASLALFPNISLFPRWPGFEEDEELAGGPTTATAVDESSLENMNLRQLGRLKGKGADVPQDLISKKRRKNIEKEVAIGKGKKGGPKVIYKEKGEKEEVKE